MKKILTLVMAFMLMIVMAGCKNEEENGGSSTVNPNSSGVENTFDSTKKIRVISREDGSGSRSAFVELLGIEQEDEQGNTIDMTTVEANITNSTSVMITSVAGNEYAIGYISLGSLNDTVKALSVDGVEASIENVKSGTYQVSRPFNIATKEGLSEVAQDFISFIMSKEGQAVIEENGYVTVVDDAQAYSGNKPEGKIVVAGSSSVTPVMEKLKEAYLSINSNATIEIQQSDSSTGMNFAIDGSCDIGMASRELKESELEKGLTSTTIAMDGIAVIVNNNNPIDDLQSEQIKNIFMGEVTTWSEIEK